MKNFKIREATKKDRPAILALIRMMGPKKLFQTNLPTYKSFFVAVVGGKVVGCGALQIYSKRICEIRSFAVHPDYQGNGIGPALGKACMFRAKERGIIELFTIANKKAKAMFQKLGLRTLFNEKYAMLVVFGKSPETLPK